MNGIITGALMNSALFLIAIFVTATVHHNRIGVDLAIVAIGVAFLSFVMQMRDAHELGRASMASYTLVATSWIIAIAAAFWVF